MLAMGDECAVVGGVNGNEDECVEAACATGRRLLRKTAAAGG